MSIVGDPELGPILASLMVGPCALEFTRLNTDDAFWLDPGFFLYFFIFPAIFSLTFFSKINNFNQI